jgi:predicted transcriptional regulator
MADDKVDRWRPDRDRINITEVYKLRYWSNKFGVSKEELSAAVKRVGSIAKDVEFELKRAPRANG